jgi:hypothetical protein
MVFRAFISVAVLFICAIAVLILYCVAHGNLVAHGDLFGPHPPVVEYKDFVTILLTALAVMIAVAAFVGAIAAVWGFTALREETHRAAEVAAKIAAEAVAKAHVETTVPRLVEEAVSFALKSKDTKADAVAEEYGKEGQ